MEKNTTSGTNIRKLCESAALQIKMENKGIELIFIDEFSMNSKYNKLYTWSKIAEKGYVKVSYDNFSMFFVIAFSSRRFYGVWGSENMMTLVEIAKFLTNIKRSRNDKSVWWIICDNASIHVSDLINKHLKEIKTSMITISSYSPCLNPWEKWIGAIKAKARKEIAKGKIITLQTIKRWIDEIDNNDLHGFITASRRETLQKIKTLIAK